jgi:hypothetical protein
MRSAEMLNANGSVYTANLRSARATDTYVLKGGGEEVWEPRFTFHGFRYVQVTGLSRKPTPEAITGIVIHSDAPMTSSFECSKRMIDLPDVQFLRMEKNRVVYKVGAGSYEFVAGNYEGKPGTQPMSPHIFLIPRAV